MATDVGGMPNGNYAQHQGYGAIDQSAYGYNTQQSSQQAPQSSTPATQTQPQTDISKDEVGWYFVEQYYTTLSRSPEKLYLFYNKRSQFVSGQETDKVAVCVGQRAINDKIKELDFQDCKVRVTNVDSQASDSNIVIQVIGELANKGQPHRKFTQTFVLATQTNGYFVLNDIFRYLIDEEEEPEQQENPAAATEDVQQVPGTESGYQEPPPTEVQPKTLTSSSDPNAVENDAKEVDHEIEEKLQPAAEETEPTVNGDAAHETEKTEEAPAAATQPEEVPAAEEERPSAPEADLEPEKPADPEPTPEPTPAKPAAAPQQQAAPPKPATPAAPMSWASRAAAANRVATPAAPAAAAPAAAKPAVPAAKTATPPSTAASSTPSAPAAAAPTAPAAQRQDAQSSEGQDEWNTVGPSHNRQPSKQTNVQEQVPQHRGYVKNVMDNVDAQELRSALEKFGKLLYFDVARQKNCAFVDFETAEGYKAAISTPIEINGEKLFVEERRMRPGSTPYIPRGHFGGGRGGRGGAGGQGAPRGGFQGPNRGGNAGRARGGFPPGAQRGGRGGAQA